MKFFPQAIVKRFNLLQPGDLFFVESHGVSLAAIKAYDKRDDEKFWVPIGPIFPKEIRPAQLLPAQGMTTISFAAAHTVGLPTNPSGWSINPPPAEIVAFVSHEQDIYLRANMDLFTGTFAPCLVKLSDGSVEYNLSRFVMAYASEWNISLERENGDLHPIVQFPPRNFRDRD